MTFALNVENNRKINDKKNENKNVKFLIFNFWSFWSRNLKNKKNWWLAHNVESSGKIYD